jgi:Peptidase_C39 like family
MTILPILSPDFAKTYERDLTKEEREKTECVWILEKTEPFDELIVSWNGMRPEMGTWTFWVSVRLLEWSPWIKYAEWGVGVQKTFKHASLGSKVESYQDAVFSKEGLMCGFQVKATAENGADLKQLDALFVCLSDLSRHAVQVPEAPLQTIQLPSVPRRSQLKLGHPRPNDLCSPTATSTAINYLLGAAKTDPISFAEKVHDSEFDIYGNWILNTAQGYQELGGDFRCRTERLPSFSTLHSYLLRGLPVIVSIRGPLVGSYRPMTFGHLVCVTGYDAKLGRVHCIDSGFPEDEQTDVSYPLKDFLDAWGRRQNIAYVFTPKTLVSSLGKMMGASSRT